MISSFHNFALYFSILSLKMQLYSEEKETYFFQKEKVLQVYLNKKVFSMVIQGTGKGFQGK